ncbi:hypothetical protein [Nitrosophilus labii]|uniref:hypothetical protein n=1 Tax=Nitrosophilus labii TaxID=2706014 RepID=UPI0016572F0B|nr:hypothetical protein [Nitrosophilus labii]
MGRKRTDMINKPNSRIVYTDCKEAETMCDLLIRTNDIFRAIREGKTDLDPKEAGEIIEKFKVTLVKTSDILKYIADKAGLDYDEPLLIFQMKNSQ